MAEAKRKTLKEKLAAGEARHRDMDRTTIVDRTGERAMEAKDKFVAFAKEHPIATVAGGLAVGVLVSSLFKRSPTRKAGRKAAALAAVGAEMAWAYAQQAMNAAQEAGKHGLDRAEHTRDAIGRATRTRGEDVAARTGELADSVREIARETGGRVARAVRSRRR